ncbi:MAG: nucleoside-triphosphatase [Oscillospiraceae bacterium]
MKRRLLLCGEIGCGKSTLIKNALGAEAKNAGGFITQRRFDENGALAGFVLLPAAALAGGNFEEREFLRFSAGGTRRFEGVFERDAARLLREAREKPFALLDELGGFELLIPEFYAALSALLESGTPCVGVLKSPPAAAELKRRVALPEGYLAAAEALRARLASDGDTLLLQTTGRHDAAAERALGAWVCEYAKGQKRYVGNI